MTNLRLQQALDKIKSLEQSQKTASDILSDLFATKNKLEQENKRLTELKNQWYEQATENGESIKKLRQEIEELKKNKGCRCKCHTDGGLESPRHCLWCTSSHSDYDRLQQENNQLKALKEILLKMDLSFLSQMMWSNWQIQKIDVFNDTYQQIDKLKQLLKGDSN